MARTLLRTPLYDSHLALGARMVPFAGWEMPIQYRSILAEARAVRTRSGIFDVSHMGRIYLGGPGAEDLLDWVATNNVRDLKPGRARYTLFCNERGGILDDGIYYRLGDDRFLVVVNAANRAAMWDWFHRWDSRFSPADMEDRTRETAMIAWQGPEAAGILDSLASGASDGLRPFASTSVDVGGTPAFIGRTGYTGEDGFEAIVEADAAPGLWRALRERGAEPCGLGARDVLRLEAGLLLHGNDVDTTTNPLEAGLERFVRWDKEHVATAALHAVREAGVERRLVGFEMVERGIPRQGYAVLGEGGQPVGRVTSGAHSPTLDRDIGLGYVTGGMSAPETPLLIDIRGRPVRARVVALPFYTRRRP